MSFGRYPLKETSLEPNPHPCCINFDSSSFNRSLAAFSKFCLLPAGRWKTCKCSEWEKLLDLNTETMSLKMLKFSCRAEVKKIIWFIVHINTLTREQRLLGCLLPWLDSLFPFLIPYIIHSHFVLGFFVPIIIKQIWSDYFPTVENRRIFSCALGDFHACGICLRRKGAEGMREDMRYKQRLEETEKVKKKKEGGKESWKDRGNKPRKKPQAER